MVFSVQPRYEQEDYTLYCIVRCLCSSSYELQLEALIAEGLKEYLVNHEVNDDIFTLVVLDKGARIEKGLFEHWLYVDGVQILC